MADYGTYADLAKFKAELGITDTTDDAILLRKLEDASRWVDRETGRHFYTATRTRAFTAQYYDHLSLNGEKDDLLSVTTLKTDEDDDRDYDYTWSATDYDLEPFDDFPKWRISVTPNGVYSFPSNARGVQIVGIWGYGDGYSAAPYAASGATITVATADGTTLTASSGTPFAVGQTLLIESEQVYITAIVTTSLTAIRGINGTTAAIHSAKAASIAVYPDAVREACLLYAKWLWRQGDAPMGSAGSGEVGVITLRRVDYEARSKVAHLRKLRVG